jgi:hypothetical protein
LNRSLNPHNSTDRKIFKAVEMVPALPAPRIALKTHPHPVIAPREMISVSTEVTFVSTEMISVPT